MEMLTMRSYAGEADLQPIANLLNACEAVDQEDNYYSPSGLKTEFTAPDLDPARDLRLWHDRRGRLVAYAQLWIPQASVEVADGFLWFKVDPAVRGHGLEPAMLAWAEARIREVGQERGLPAKLASSCRESHGDRIALLETHGFTYERCFLTMTRSLAEPIATPQWPAGFVLVDERQSLDDVAYAEMFNQSFIDHWNFHPLTVEQIQHSRTDPNYRRDLNLVAIAPNGPYAGFCFCYVDPEENRHRNCREGWIGSLGTRRGFRRIGLARALLLAGLERLQAAGLDTALLGVDTQNPNQAYTLYESVGFRKRHASFTYSKLLT